MKDAFASPQSQNLDYEEKKQQVADLEIMIADFDRMANELDHHIKIEQQASGITDVTHYAYPTFARSAITRRDNLKSSVAELQKRLEKAKEELSEAFEHLKISEMAETYSAQKQPRSVNKRKNQRFVGSLSENR